MKKSVMLRIDNLERINNLKNEYKQLEGINLTTENIFNKGLETFEKSLFEKKIVKLANPDLKISQIALLKDAINQNLGMDYLEILTQDQFKSGPLVLLISAGLKYYSLDKFKLVANPELKASMIEMILNADQTKEMPYGLMASFTNPEFSVSQLAVLLDAYTKKGFTWNQLEDVINPKISVSKIAMIIDAFPQN